MNKMLKTMVTLVTEVTLNQIANLLGVELRTFLNRPNHANVCSQVIRFASGKLSFTSSGL